MGINLAKHKMISFVTSSFFAGIGGAMYAVYVGSTNAAPFTSALTYEILLIVVIGGIGSLSGVGQWALAIVGYLGILYVMFSGARRLEIRQNRTYGADSEYQKYSTTVPILLPLIPLYSVEKHKWLVA